MPESHPHSVSRRDFLARSGRMTGARLLGSSSETSAAPVAAPRDSIPAGLPRRTLGRTQEPVTTFTLGTAAFGSLPPHEIAQLVNFTLDQGVNSVDTSQQYQNAQEGVGLALGKRRQDVFLGTKVFANTIEEAEASLARQHNVGIMAMTVYGGMAG